MLPEDERRLQREADIARAVRGPDDTLYKEDIRAAREYVMKRAAISRETYQRERAGYHEAAARGEIQRIDGAVPPFRDDPTLSR